MGRPASKYSPKGEGLSLTQEILRQHLGYNEHTGEFVWLQTRSGGALAGDPAGTRRAKYKYIYVHGKSYLAHRLAWFWMTGIWPEHGIDHINGNKLDNGWSNLRLATHSENMMNRPKKRNNSSGFKGVTRSYNRWEATIRCNNSRYRLGRFVSAVDAAIAYDDAAIKYFGRFAVLNFPERIAKRA